MRWVEFYVTTDGQPASLSWYKAPIWGLRPDLYYSYDNYGFLFLWGALSHERTGLTFIYAAGPCQRNLSLVRAPCVSRPYFTVSHLRLPFSSPPTTPRVTVEVFDPASTRGEWMRSYASPLYNFGKDRIKATTCNSSSFSVCLFVTAGTCLATLYPATDVLPLLSA
jgi:hypothetical protein